MFRTKARDIFRTFGIGIYGMREREVGSLVGLYQTVGIAWRGRDIYLHHHYVALLRDP